MSHQACSCIKHAVGLGHSWSHLAVRVGFAQEAHRGLAGVVFKPLWFLVTKPHYNHGAALLVRLRLCCSAARSAAGVTSKCLTSMRTGLHSMTASPCHPRDVHQGADSPCGCCYPLKLRPARLPGVPSGQGPGRTNLKRSPLLYSRVCCGVCTGVNQVSTCPPAK